jgi:DNA repair exonuclease SbcCD ATPase subunit
MKIIQLTAENIKKLRAVEIEPTGPVVTLTGRNEAGKSTVLESIMMALRGAKFDPAEPITRGEEKGSIKIDLGDYEIILNLTQKGRYLTMYNKEGVKVSAPQKILDEIVGPISFDPVAFLSKPEKEQLQILLDLLEIDITELDSRKKKLYDKRTEIGRDVTRLEGLINSTPLYRDAPKEEIVIKDVVEQLNTAIAQNAELTITRTRFTENEKSIAAWRAQIEQAEKNIHKLEQANQIYTKRIQETPVIDTEAIQATISEVEETNKKVRQNQKRRETKVLLDKAKEDYDTLTTAIKDIEDQKKTLIAEAPMPIQGLSFDETGIRFDDLPLKQISTGKGIIIATAIGMALNPDLRVLIIREGNNLDSINFQAIEELAANEDFQVWIEKVDESGKLGIYIEEGEVIAVNPSPAPVSPTSPVKKVVKKAVR